MGGNRRRCEGPGVEEPILDAPRRDCSRQRLRPDPDRFGHLLSQTTFSFLSGATWEERDAAAATHTCMARVA